MCSFVQGWSTNRGTACFVHVDYLLVLNHQHYVASALAPSCFAVAYPLSLFISLIVAFAPS